ncbi:hypothetical protein BDV33DRAFT_179691 [Aspergillus novoparasiticus]|uniref:Uncharacterized protein n=1 Tax=Aspergillus novoparasiticus TaxID=986946 RepID=A0A5N6EGX3_9EURO|nr:hypothetical protein BDV33DRAFT_179691 [Aspergillus novoparasiticus]
MRFLKASREAIGLLCLCRCPGEMTTELGQGIISPQATVQEENIVSSPSGQGIFIEYSRLRGYNCLRLRTQPGPKAVAGHTDQSTRILPVGGRMARQAFPKAGSIHFHSGPVLPVIFVGSNTVEI